VVLVTMLIWVGFHGKVQ